MSQVIPKYLKFIDEYARDKPISGMEELDIYEILEKITLN